MHLVVSLSTNVFGQKSKTLPIWATRCIFLGSRCWSLLLFLKPLKILGDCTASVSLLHLLQQRPALWSKVSSLTQACFIPWRYDGESFTPSKSRWILKHMHKKVSSEGPSVRSLEVDTTGRWRRREGIIQAARRAEKWSWVTSFWPGWLQVL